MRTLFRSRTSCPITLVFTRVQIIHFRKNIFNAVMDSYSGRFPLDFISFCLGMATEQQTENSELTTAGPSVSVQGLPERHADPSQENRPTEIDALPGVRPLSNLSSSSGNTEESLSTFAEQTLQHLAQMDPSLDVTFLSAPSKGFPQG